MWGSTVGGMITLLLGLLATPSTIKAQPAKHVPHLGFLSGGSPAANAARVTAFRQGLQELGYVEGHTLVSEWRYAEGQLERLPALAAELVRLEVDVIVMAAPGPACAAKEVTATIPIVMAYDSDPVGNGFVASLGHPGGNMTGLSSLAPEISSKQLELLRELVPRLSRVAVRGGSARSTVSAPNDLPCGGIRGSRGATILRRELSGHVPPCCDIRGQDPQRHQARGLARGAAKTI